MGTIFSWLIFLLFIYLLLKFVQSSNRMSEVHAHWQHYFDTVQFSSQEVYNTIEQIVREKEITSLQTAHIKYAEGSVFSANRDYLRISRDTIVFDICAAPFAKGFFISSWQGYVPDMTRSFILSLPFIGKIVEQATYRKTFYKIDTEQMYISAVHASVLEAIDRISNQQGVRLLTPSERQLQSQAI